VLSARIDSEGIPDTVLMSTNVAIDVSLNNPAFYIRDVATGESWFFCCKDMDIDG
jgi:hypothetical protein